jgi:nitroreductase
MFCSKLFAEAEFGAGDERGLRMTLYDTIYARRSVRRYDEAALEAGELSELQDYLDGLRHFPGQAARFEVVGKDKLKGGIAPYAILAYSDDSDMALTNIGYTLQEVDLWLQGRGLGSVWCGMAAPLEKREDYRILLGFGRTDVAPRAGEQDFDRKKITEISNEDNAVARAARLAPSAVNLQPWKLRFSDGRIRVEADVRGVSRLLPGRLWLYGFGIILKHIELALAHEGEPVSEFAFSGSGKNIAATAEYRG